MKVSNPVNAIASAFMTGSVIVTLLLLLIFRSISRIMVSASSGINLTIRLEVSHCLMTSPEVTRRMATAAIGHQIEESTFKLRYPFQSEQIRNITVFLMRFLNRQCPERLELRVNTLPSPMFHSSR